MADALGMARQQSFRLRRPPRQPFNYDGQQRPSQTISPVDVAAAKRGTNANTPGPNWFTAFPDAAQRPSFPVTSSNPGNAGTIGVPGRAQSRILGSQESDRIFGNPALDVAGTGKTMATPYGNVSSTVQPKGQPLAPAVTTANGVSREPFDVASARKSLMQTNPDVFKGGTEANKAFVDYAKTNGEEAAHAWMNAQQGPTPAQVAQGVQQNTQVQGPGLNEDANSPLMQTAQANVLAGRQAKIAANTAANNAVDNGTFRSDSTIGQLANSTITPPAKPSLIDQGANALGLSSNATAGLKSAVSGAANTVKNWFGDGGDNAPVATQPVAPTDPATAPGFKFDGPGVSAATKRKQGLDTDDDLATY